MSRKPCVPRVVDDPDDARRNALESQLLSLLAGFQRLHRVSQGEMCEVLIDCVDWLCCPDYATRVSLVEVIDQGEESAPRKRGVR
jgi:hypothetical protein